MNMQIWVRKSAESLAGKAIGITGAAGGLRNAVFRYILSLSGRFIMVSRNPQKFRNLISNLFN